MIKQIDLLPVSYMIGNAIRRRARKWMFVLVGSVVVILGVSASIRMSSTALEVELLPIKEKIERGAVHEMEMALLASELRNTLERKTSMESLMADPFWCGLLGDIATSTAEDMWLLSIDITKLITDVEGSEMVMEESNVTITGHAESNEDIVAFYQELKNSQYTRDVKLQEARMDAAQDDLMYFEVVLKVV